MFCFFFFWGGGGGWLIFGFPYFQNFTRSEFNMIFFLSDHPQSSYPRPLWQSSGVRWSELPPVRYLSLDVTESSGWTGSGKRLAILRDPKADIRADISMSKSLQSGCLVSLAPVV